MAHTRNLVDEQKLFWLVRILIPRYDSSWILGLEQHTQLIDSLGMCILKVLVYFRDHSWRIRIWSLLDLHISLHQQDSGCRCLVRLS